MKRLTTIVFGFWVLNPFLHMLYLVNRPLFDQFIAAGAELYYCADFDSNGNLIPGVCEAPPPSLP